MKSPSSSANSLPFEAFRKDFLDCSLQKHQLPKGFELGYRAASNISNPELQDCLKLVRSTSEDGYKNSSLGWSSKQKLHEMQESDMRFLLVRQASETNSEPAPHDRISEMVGFLSFMLTVEDEIEVVYCYEVHLLPSLRGQRIGETLMHIMEDTGRAAGMVKAMLTVFTSNVGARKFYERIGYTLYDEEAPPPRKRLRSRMTEPQKPTFVILAKDLA